MAKVGYERVSSDTQVLDRQRDALEAAGCDRIFSDFAQSGRLASRPEFDECMKYLRAGDTLVVTELSRLGRSTKNLLTLAEELRERQVNLSILNLGLDTSTVSGKLVFTILAAVSEMEVELLRERTNEGLAAARARGRTGGRKPSLTPAQVRHARKLYEGGEHTVATIAGALGVSRQTVYRALERTAEEAVIS